MNPRIRNAESTLFFEANRRYRNNPVPSKIFDDRRQTNGDGDENWDRKSRRFTVQKLKIKTDDSQTDGHVTAVESYIGSEYIYRLDCPNILKSTCGG